MKAVIYTEFGSPDVLHVADVPAPIPKAGDVLIRVRAASVAFGDLIARDFGHVTGRDFHMPRPLLFLSRLHFGFKKPKVHILGSELSGEVEAVGDQVTRFMPGDQVYGFLGQHMGAHAEHVCMPHDGALAKKPANMTHEEAATVPYGALMAMSLLRHVNLQPGQKVLINGASGGIGSAATQLAKIHGAEVTGVCGAPRLAYVKALGADHVIDYAAEDFTQNGETYDLIFDVLGKSTFARCRGSLTPGGVYLLASFKTKALLQMAWTKVAGPHKVVCALASEQPGDLDVVRELIEAGKYRSIVDRCFSLEEAAEAHRYAESGAKTGSVVLSIAR